MKNESGSSPRMYLVDDYGKPQEVFEISGSLTLAANGLKPATTYDIGVTAIGRELFGARLITTSSGEIEPTVIWPQIGMDDPEGRGMLTYDEAQRRWKGGAIQVSIRSGGDLVLESQVRLSEQPGRPLLLTTDRRGRSLNGFEQGAQGLFLTPHNLPFEGEARIYMVPRQHDWRAGDALSPATLTDGSAAIREITVKEGSSGKPIEFASATQVPVGAFDFVLRPLRYGYEQDQELRLLPRDILSSRRVAGVVIREEFWTAKPVLGGCVNKLPVSGRSISGAPYFQYSDTFEVGENVYAALDPGIVDPANVSKMCSFYVIPNMGQAQWDTHPLLNHLATLGGNPATVKIQVQGGCINANKVLIWPNASQIGEYDIVADFGNNTPDPMAFAQDDHYDTPLDIIDGYFVAGFRVVEDPGTLVDPGLFAGSWNYTEADVDAMGLAGTVTVDDEGGPYVTPGAFPLVTRDVRLKANVCFPADAAGVSDPAQISASQPDYPLVVIVHGNGHDYTAYDFLLQHFARNGFVAASIDNRYVNGNNLSHGMAGLGRAHVFFHHLAVLKAKFGSKLQNNVGVMGHSRGGEAVVKIARLNQEQALGNNINGLLALAPTDRYGKETLADAFATPFFVLYGSRDGDVSGGAPGGQFDWRATGFSLYDRASGAMKTMGFVYRATHNGFVTTNYDNPGDSPLPEAAQRAITQAYANAFFRQHLRSEATWEGMFTGLWKPASVAASGAEIYFQYRVPGGKVVDEFEGAVPDWQSSTLGGGVSHGGTLPSNPGEGRLFDFPPTQPGLDTQSPHYSNGLKVNWDQLGDRLAWSIPAAHQDVSGFSVLSLRVTQKEASPSNTANQAQDFRVRLKDAANNERAIRASAFGPIPFPDQRSNSALRKSALAAVRIPLSSYTIVCAGQPKVDLASVVEMSLEFSIRATGEVEVDEIEFTN
jgi:hypothetical protein